MGWNNRDIFIDHQTQEEVRILIHNYGGKGVHLTMRKPVSERISNKYYQQLHKLITNE